MQSIEIELKKAIQKAIQKSFDLEVSLEQIAIEIPKNKDHGDFSSNVAMQLTRTLKQNPRNIATQITEALDKESCSVSSMEIAGPGFINFTLDTNRYSKVIEEILEKKENYGQQPSNGIKVNLEYVSANPTGSLHLGHARGAAWGDSCARIMKKAGYDVTREYYVNDAGNQITNLALSLNARYRQAHGIDTEIGADGYLGDDVKEKGYALAKEYPNQYLEPTPENLNFFRKEGITFELDKIKEDLKEYRVEFDVWSSEQAIRDAGKVEEALQLLDEKGYTYRKDGALWFTTTKFGDDKDRVLQKTDGSYTYLVPDIAYHNDKFKRGFDVLVDFFGADHHGYIPRLKGSMTALGNDASKLHVDIIQMVRLVSNGEEVKMSKRLGNATTISELVESVGVDAARYFFVQRALDSHLDFDVELAKKQSNDNPVYYAQYAHARMCSIQKQAQDISLANHFERLNHEKEIELLKTLQEFNKVITESARTRQVHKVCHYIQNLASKFHSFYNACKVLDPQDIELTSQRLALVKATQIVLANALECIGVQAVESM
ncbi:arginine--tRNA ligase [Faecalicoccus pleomorphus]|uniref:arginine--tRNA ligase n=1 Tax=Faecalicoccus TaxID=1573536 RepID=UPI00232EAF3F|nr:MULTISPECIES: arginine--tRNA ligase [Faecalicoccus]MDB7988152.1 arginine--tRNA ligase [Faecalicoccus pleomorphus]MDB7992501.1 arginine--tRNA ligase [Faecalicoccus pleomorphus]MDY4277377.1 arginine--tRNA ligase [Faecalicoccus sp.]